MELALLLTTAWTVAAADTCAYRGCHPVQAGKLNVHLVPHTHDDVGWLKTVDQYYYGSNKVHAPFGVQYILDSVVSELLKNKNRKFIYVESAFLWRWWQEQEPDSQAAVSQLVREGRLQLVHGGWCMSDEATPHYSMLIDQMTFGLKFLKDTFGECGVPKIAWQIDPFGHSSEVALQFAEMGYDGLFMGRIDHEDYYLRREEKTLEHIWRPDTSLGEAGELFTGVLYNLYMAPDGFCFDTYCSDEPIMDNPKLHSYNVVQRIAEFVAEARLWAAKYKTNHVQITMGGDFNYIVAASWFKNMDKLIKYINQNYTDTNVLYSSPACYLKALNEENTTWPVKDNQDYFPYGSDQHSYWTGYFTSRPNLKNLVFRANNVLQVVKQLRSTLGTELEEEEMVVNRAVGIAQHHDAVSGTSKQHVTDDYALYLSEALDASENIFTSAYRKWLGNDLPAQKFCRLANISECEVVEQASKFTVTVYNPLSHKVTHPVRVAVTQGRYKVTGPTGEEIPNELLPVPESVMEILGRESNATVELFFYAEDVPPLGLLSFHVERSEGGAVPVVVKQNISLPLPNVTAPLEFIPETPDNIEVGNSILTLIFNINNGFLQYIKREKETWAFRQNFYFYEGSKGYNYNSFNRASGAYIFRPAKNDVEIISSYANISVFKGKFVTEVHQVFKPWISQIIRLYEGKDQIEFEWLVGPIPVERWVGKEVITRYTTQLVTNATLYTDSNGRRLVKRVRNKPYWYRKDLNHSVTEPVASNYYPVTSAAVILGNLHRVTVLTDRPQGAASLADGQVELMLHRRLLYDDSKGVGEPLDETQFGKGMVSRGLHIVQLSTSDKLQKARSKRETEATNTTESSSTNGNNNLSQVFGDGAERHRLQALHLIYSPLLTFTRTDLSAADWSKKYRMKYPGLLKNPLPMNIHLLTLERWSNTSLLIRLEHLFEANEHPEYAQHVSVDLKNLLVDFNVTKVVELSLAANQELEKVSRLHWKVQGPRVNITRQKLMADMVAVLAPMDIRTFQLFGTLQKPAS